MNSGKHDVVDHFSDRASTITAQTYQHDAGVMQDALAS
jgi:hypothetical protein